MDVHIQCLFDEMVDPRQLKDNPHNRNIHPQEQIERLSQIYQYQGVRHPIIVSKRSGFIVSGHGRKDAAIVAGLDKMPVVYQDFDTDEQEYAFIQSDNAIARWADLDLAGINADLGELGPDFNLDLLGIQNFTLDFADRVGADGLFDQQDLGAQAGGAPIADDYKKTLADRFIVPPFSILDTRQGYWKARKQQWLSLGIKSEVGRAGNLLGMSDTVLQPDPSKRIDAAAFNEMLKNDPQAKTISAKIPGYFNKKNQGMSDEDIIAEFLQSSQISAGTSIFDPVLCELAYRWFTPSGGTVLDPFAGGSVRGVVASKLGLQYVGCELRQEQVDANRQQASDICSNPMPVWACGDSRKIDKHCEGVQADLLFSCPPYHDLEVYSENENDISNMEWDEFMQAYREIIKKAASMLKQNRFAVWVITEIRKDGAGFYKNFIRETINCFEAAGLEYYNEMVLVNSVGTLPIRAGRMFSATRKVGRTHQNVLVFCKGDPRLAAEECGQVEVELPFDPSVATELGAVVDGGGSYGELVTASEAEV